MGSPEPFRSLGFYAIAWIEHFLVHGPGDVQGEPIDLDDEFGAFIVKSYELDSRGGRKVRRAFLSRSKGRSKSGLAAMIECFEALGECRFDHWAEAGEVSDWGYEYEEGEPVGKRLMYAEILNVATEEGQAGNTYDAVYYMLHEDTCSEALRQRFGKLDAGLTRINLPDKRGFIEPVTAANESKDGGKSTFIVADETHLWIPPAVGKFKLGKMHQTMVRNLLKRKIASGWMLETSTMYAEGERSVAEGTHAYAKALKKSGRRDAKLLFDHRQASMDWDLTKRPERIKALKEAYGPAAAWMDLQAIADYWDDPQASEADFRRFWLNQPVPLEEKPPPVFARWSDRIVTERPQPQALGIAADVRQQWLSLAAFGHGFGGAVQRFRFESGRKVYLAEVKRISEEYGVPVAVQAKSPAASLIPSLEALGVKVLEETFADFVQSLADLRDDIESGDFTHGNDYEMNRAVEAAGWKVVAKQLVLDAGGGDISMAEALVAARWAALSAPKPLEPFAIWG